MVVSWGRACSHLIAGDEETTHWPNCPGFVQCWRWQLSHRACRKDEECTSLQIHPEFLIHPRQKGLDRLHSSTPRHSPPQATELLYFSTRDPETQPIPYSKAATFPAPKYRSLQPPVIAPNRGKPGLVLATRKQFDNGPAPSMGVNVYLVTKENGTSAGPRRHG